MNDLLRDMFLGGALSSFILITSVIFYILFIGRYYYQNFPQLGRRIEEPAQPPRKMSQPRVSCDIYEEGSCRWYDEWGYDHLVEYRQNQHNFV